MSKLLIHYLETIVLAYYSQDLSLSLDTFHDYVTYMEEDFGIIVPQDHHTYERSVKFISEVLEKNDPDNQALIIQKDYLSYFQ